MSIERDLLRRIVEGDNRGDFFISNEFLKEIEATLAQPEQDNIQYLLDQVARLTAENAMLKEKWSTPKPEQEPAVWQVIGIAGFMYVYNKPRDQVYEHHTVNALYLTPQKREPLSDEEIYDRCCAMDNSYTCIFIDGVEWAEHQHGIRSFDDE